MNEKQLVGEKATDFIKDGMVIGLGTGSTAYWAIKKVSELVQPVEIIPFAWKTTISQLKQLGCSAHLRLTNNEPFLTDNNNFIVDCKFNKIEESELIANNLNSIPGVIENGLFLNMADILITVDSNGKILILK